MITTYLVIKFVHVLLAITAVGFTSTFGITLAAAAARPAAMMFALNAVKRLQSISTPAFAGLVLTGLAMAWLGNLSWTALWFVGSLVLALLAMAVARTVARPTLLRQLALLERPEAPVEELRKLGSRSRKVGMFLSMTALVIVALMIFKPTL